MGVFAKMPRLFWQTGKSCASKHLDRARGMFAKIPGFWPTPPCTGFPQRDQRLIEVDLVGVHDALFILRVRELAIL